ncbi:MAG TPA: 50S ribosomal protein L11 methyltransferase [Cyclobacteriaceae bacterium]|mgnify:CR=1 FL=1|nr:50S ribosomal protein L11 methyltransferase [Cyclobacteriaceae bacterium]
MYSTRLQVVCDPEFSEILMAEIVEAGFDTFMETEKGFEAYVEGDNFDRELLSQLQEKYKHVNPLLFFQDQIQKQNWNEEWEKNVDPIFVDDKCLVRAAFHKIEKKYPYEIIITPKMSFGTGHHQTTHLMISRQMKMNHQGKRVMDAGCGTAILSIMASKLGAKEVEAFDIDEWSVINGVENTENNGCANIHIQQGKIDEVKLTGKFDIILANINKNILLQEMHHYASYLEKGSLLLLSGFYTHDIEDLKSEASKYDLKEIAHDERETWACLLLQA